MTSEVLSTDGGPAFPIVSNAPSGAGGSTVASPNQTVAPGMSLRDYFAAQALVANKGWIVGTADEAARDAYTIADAMLKAREAKNV